MQRLQPSRSGSYVPLFEDYYGEVESVPENDTTQNSHDWRNAETRPSVNARRISPTADRYRGRNDTNSSFQAKGSRTPISHHKLYKLRPGDHIGWHRPTGIWHHAIVVDVDLRDRKLVLIHYQPNGRELVKGKVIKESCYFNRQKGDCFRFDYSDDDLRRSPREVVLARAHEHVGQKGYHLFKNNCEHFATYCKTGRGDCCQTRWAWRKTLTTINTSAVTCWKTGTRLVCQELSQLPCASMATRSAGTVAAAEGAEFLARASDWVGAGLVAGIETCHCIYDIYNLRQNYKRGNMTQRDYRVSSTQRVCEGAGGAGLAILGGLKGAAVGASIGSIIPGIGTTIGALVGSVIGGAVCSTIGKIVGSIFGNWFGKKIW